jgi:hypothetical protein
MMDAQGQQNASSLRISLFSQRLVWFVEDSTHAPGTRRHDFSSGDEFVFHLAWNLLYSIREGLQPDRRLQDLPAYKACGLPRYSSLVFARKW